MYDLLNPYRRADTCELGDEHVDVIHVDARQIFHARVARTSVLTASNRGKLADSKSPLEI